MAFCEWEAEGRQKTKIPLISIAFLLAFEIDKIAKNMVMSFDN